jgi:hypothetical protein
MRRRFLVLPLVAIFLVQFARPTLTHDVAGKIKGTATDPSGAAVVGASITASNVKN